MKITDITQLSIDIITEYYKNNLQPFFDNIDEDITWIGPAEGQWIQGRTPLIDTWSKEQHDLTFSMSSIVSTPISTSPAYCEIILNYIVTTYYPDGRELYHKQCLHYTWCERRAKNADGSIHKIPKIIVIHISNAFPYDEQDTIYPVHYVPLSEKENPAPKDDTRILVKGIDQSTYYLIPNVIQWMESTNKGFHTLIHTTEHTIEVTSSLSSLASKYSDFFLRIHSGYLINPYFASKISRFQLEMLDKTILPIPQKKYSMVKNELERYLL